MFYKISIKLKVILFSTLFFWVSFLSIIGLVKLYNKFFYYNDTISEPVGHYFVVNAEHIVANGIYTVVLHPEYMKKLRKLGYRANSGTLLKQVVAQSSDTINVTKSGVFVNNKLILNSKPIKNSNDIGLEAIPVGYHRLLQDGEFWVMGNTPHSVDSRYFGVVNKKQIHQTAYFIF